MAQMIVLGFGSVEQHTEREIINAFAAGGPEALKTWNAVADVYDKLPRGTAPQRYSRVFYYDGRLHFHHVNREHPFSPDGWALLQTERSVHIKKGPPNEKA